MSNQRTRLHRLLNTPPVLRPEPGGAPLSQATVCPALRLSVSGQHTIRCTKRVGHEGDHFFGGFPEPVARPHNQEWNDETIADMNEYPDGWQK